jgi:predicted alpha/beta-hydrolase family hydrolase
MRRGSDIAVSAPEGFSLVFDVADGARIDGRWRPAEGARRQPVLLAHGAGAGHELPLLAALSDALAAERFDVLAFHYPYMERRHREGRRRPPDRRPVLEAAHARALLELARLRPGRRALLVGKSMGGRIGSLLAAQGADVQGLVLVGYPLHPAADPERERSEHFRALVQPALFLSGTRDALCELPRLSRALATYGGRAELEVIEGADHDFAQPRRERVTPETAAADLARRIAQWVDRTWPE